MHNVLIIFYIAFSIGNLFILPELTRKTAEFILRAGGDCPAIQVPKGVFHTSVCLEDGSVIFEAKDGAYKPISPEDVL